MLPGLEAGRTRVIPGDARSISCYCPPCHSISPDSRAAPTADGAGRAAEQHLAPCLRPPVTGAPSSRPRRGPPHCRPAPDFKSPPSVHSLNCSHGHLSKHRSAHLLSGSDTMCSSHCYLVRCHRPPVTGPPPAVLTEA